MDKYIQWINENGPQDPKNVCMGYTKKMHEIFPELIICRGYFTDVLGNKYPHAWLKTQDGVIVDPTRGQFLCDGEDGTYTEVIEGMGSFSKCCNCGTIFKGHGYFCNEDCAEEYLRET